MDVYSANFSEEAFKKIDKDKLEYILKLMNDMQNKNADERIQILFTYGLEMRSKNIHFTKEESGLLIELLKTNLSDSERTKLDAIAGIMKSM